MSFRDLLRFFAISILFLCNSHSFGNVETLEDVPSAPNSISSSDQIQKLKWFQKPATLPQNFPLYFEGASLSNGVGAHFSMANRLIAHFNKYPEVLEQMNQILDGKKVVILIDYFFVTHFPYWSNMYDSKRKAVVDNHFQKLESNYDILLYSPLPHDQMLFEDLTYSKKQWKKFLEQKDRSQIKNQLSRHWAAKLFNPFPLRVRDEINRYIDARAKAQPQKYYEIELAPTLREWVANGYTRDSFGNRVNLEEMFFDHVHFNDLGQTVFLNQVILPSLEKTIIGLMPKTYKTLFNIPRFEIDSGRYNQDWVLEESAFVFKSETDFEKEKSGIYKLVLNDTESFFGSKMFSFGEEASTNPRFTSLILGKTLPLYIDFYSGLSFINSIPIFRNQKGQTIINMMKPIQAAITPLFQQERGTWVGYMRDYVTAMGGVVVNFRVRLTKVENSPNLYIFSWEVFPRIPGQSKEKIRGPMSMNEIRLLNLFEHKLHKLHLQGEASFF